MNKFVCVLTTIHPQNDARIFERTILPLANAGYEVEVIAPWNPIPSEFNITWVQTTYPKTRFARLLHGFTTFTKAFNSKSQVVHFHDIDFLLWGFFLKIFAQKKVIYDCHENYPEEILFGKPWIPIFLRKLASSATYWIEVTCVRYFDHNVVVVPSLLKKFSRFSKSVTLVRNLSIYKAQKDLIHQDNILYTGTISLNYGGENILELARVMKKNLSTMKIITFDKFDSSYRSEFVEAIKLEDLPIVVNKKFTRNQISDVMSLGMIGLSFSLDTLSNNLGYPTKLFEYMSFGVPVVASNTLRHQQILNISNSGVLVAHTDMNAVYMTILDLMNDPETVENLKNNGYFAVEYTFNWKTEEKALLNIYKDIFN